MMGDSGNTFFSSCYDPHAFFYVTDPVDWDRNLLLQAAGPPDLHSVKLVHLPQPEVYAPRALSGIAIAAVNLTDLPHPTGFNGYAGAKDVSINTQYSESNGGNGILWRGDPELGCYTTTGTGAYSVRYLLKFGGLSIPAGSTPEATFLGRNL